MSGKKIFYKAATQRLKKIHKTSVLVNTRKSRCHQKRLLEMMRHHIDEIEELAAGGNKHFLTETGDLAVLCLELLLENQSSPDVIMERCLGRFERKLDGLLIEIRRKGKSLRCDQPSAKRKTKS